MRAVIVQNKVQRNVAGKLSIDLAQEAEEFLMAVLGKTLADDLSIEDVEGCKQRRRPVPLTSRMRSAD